MQKMPNVLKRVSCTIQLSMKFQLLIKTKMQKIPNVLKTFFMQNSTEHEI